MEPSICKQLDSPIWIYQNRRRNDCSPQDSLPSSYRWEAVAAFDMFAVTASLRGFALRESVRETLSAISCHCTYVSLQVGKLCSHLFIFHTLLFRRVGILCDVRLNSVNRINSVKRTFLLFTSLFAFRFAFRFLLCFLLFAFCFLLFAFCFALCALPCALPCALRFALGSSFAPLRAASLRIRFAVQYDHCGPRYQLSFHSVVTLSVNRRRFAATLLEAGALGLTRMCLSILRWGTAVL